MITRINKNVISIKDIPSNLIEEAIFILKTNEDNGKGLTVKNKNKDIIMTEVNEIIKDCSNKLEMEHENIKRIEKRQSDKLKRLKVNIVTTAIIILTISFIFFLVK